ncbi:MAG: DUF5615 family PIN-like protein [Gemmataceae bacterium]
MTFVADENLFGPVVDRLRADGWTVIAAGEQNRGAQDPDLLALAHTAGAILLTQDKDFGELVYRQGLPHCGIVLIRLPGLSLADRAERVSQEIRDNQAVLANAFTVIGRQGVRIRKPVPPPDSADPPP